MVEEFGEVRVDGSVGKSVEMFDLLFIGHVAKDVIEVGGVETVSAGGGVYYGGFAALKLGKTVGVVTRCKESDTDLLESLQAAGATVHYRFSDQTSGIHNIYDDPSMETRRCFPIGFAGLITMDQVPEEVDARYIVIAPIMAGEVDMAMIRFLHEHKRGKICLDVQGFVRVRDGERLIFKDWIDKREGMKMVEILKMDHAEARNLTGLDDISDALEEVSSWGPREILLTHSAGISVYCNGKIEFYSWKNETMAGRTGRGDTSFSSYISSRLDKPPKLALRLSAAMTSLKMEEPGPIDADLADILEFEKNRYDLT
ncbi:MAG: hypothetical protein ACTSUE_19725 [Promethearchaeota archaeon]